MATTEQFSLRWNNFHSNLTSGFHELLEASEMVDVTLAVDGHFFQAHKVVLSICSPYFKQMFKANPCKHPIVILKDVGHDNMKDILEFMYMGEVNVLRENLSTFLRTAELLQVKGLTGDDSSDTSSRRDDKSDSLADNEEDQDLTQMIDSDVELSSHYTNTHVPSPTPPPVTQNTLPLSQPNSNSKRQSKTSHSNQYCKRTKSEHIIGQNLKSEPNISHSKSIVEESDYPELKSDKSTPLDLLEDNKDNLKQILENNLNTTVSPDPNSSEQDVLLYNVDQKGHVYCPYCCRKFVNRYNLKVHIRDKHEDSPISLDCRICGKVMRNRSCLRVHMYHHRKQQLEAEAKTAVPTV